MGLFVAKYIGFVYFILLLVNINFLYAGEHEIGKNDTIKLGLLVQDHKWKGAIQGAELACEQINGKGGIQGHPLKVVIQSMEGPWGIGGTKAVNMIFNDHVWAILGSHDGRNAHLVEQVSAKARVVYLSAWSGDPTLSQAFVPWYFSCVPNYNQQADALIEEIVNQKRITKIILIADESYDSKFACRAIKNKSNSFKDVEVIQFNSGDFSTDFEKLVNQDSDENYAVVFVNIPSNSERTNKILNAKSEQNHFYLTLSAQSEIFFDEIKVSKPDKTNFITTIDFQSQNWRKFHDDFLERFACLPGVKAAYTYDGIYVLATAIKNSALQRHKLKEEVMRIEKNGVTGNFKFDERGNRVGDIGFVNIDSVCPVE
ncbi:ABC transporter substrate-binding protein [Sunxiuqinia sp. A32]|uniref:ABC transporter substrate-binding protein n=1 Tax=Sunxiuqinia sp. A32 TaxID=3461496 RepID=UPI004045A8E0